MPSDKKEKEKKSKKSTITNVYPETGVPMTQEVGPLRDAVGSGYDSSSETSLPPNERLDAPVEVKNAGSFGTTTVDGVTYAGPLNKDIPSPSSKKSKDKSSKSKEKEKKKEKNIASFSQPSSSEPAAPMSPRMDLSTSTPAKNPDHPRTPSPSYSTQFEPTDGYEGGHQSSDTDEKMFRAITDYFTKGNTRTENEKRAVLMGVAKDGSCIRIAPGASVRLADGYTLGDNTYIGLFTYVNGSVEIGADVTIGPHCSITSNNHLFNATEQSFKGANENKPIRIQRGTWVAANCTITAGTCIGECVLVCAGAVVTRDVPSYSIVAGIPARVVGSIDPYDGKKTWHDKESSLNVKASP